MSFSRSASAFLLVALVAVCAAAQSRMAGKVVEVIDGRTVVIDTDGRKVRAEIQFIEIPEPEQALRDVVREHLSKLTLDKQVEFYPQGFSPGKAFGRLYVGQLDVAMQMLRDGAAWHVPAERSGQEQAEAQSYASHQAQARSEKRGVWGVDNMKPAWEFRAEKMERSKEAAQPLRIAAVDTSKKMDPTATMKALSRRSGFWSDSNPWLRNPGPLVNGYNAASKTGYVGTSLMGVKEMEGQPADMKTAVDVTYFYKQSDGDTRKGTFVLTVVSESGTERFAKTNMMSVMVDEKKYPVKAPKRLVAKEDGRIVEKLTYELDKATVDKIAFGGEVFLNIGSYVLVPRSGLQLLLYNMLQVAN